MSRNSHHSQRMIFAVVFSFVVMTRLVFFNRPPQKVNATALE
jgi:hypothetical protein